MKLDDAAAHLEALGNPTRLKIYRTLIRAGAAGLPVGRLQERSRARKHPVAAGRDGVHVADVAGPSGRSVGQRDGREAHR